MDDIQCIKLPDASGYLIVNLNTLKYCKVTNSRLYDIQNSHATMNELLREIGGEAYEKRLSPSTPRRLVAAHLMPSYSCNYKCTYCYQNNRKDIHEKMSIDSIYKIDEFYILYNKTFRTDFIPGSISVTGGEPFLPSNRPLLEAIISHWKDTNIIFTTNGTYINNYQELLKTHTQINIQVSIDGTREMHYKTRIPTNVNDYDYTIEGIKWAVSQGISVGITCVYHPEFLDLYPSFFDVMTELGWLHKPNISLTFTPLISGAGSGSVNLDYLCRALDSFSELKKRDARAYYVNSQQLMPGLSAFQDSLAMARNRQIYYSYRCESLAKPSYAFMPDGSVRVCACMESDLGIVGRYWPTVEIYEERIKEILNRCIEHMYQCSKCNKRVFCLGGCFATVLSKTESISGTDCGIWENPVFLTRIDEYLNFKNL